MKVNRTSPANVTAREREREAIDLRRAGLSYSAIGRRLGCGSSTAHRAVSACLDRVVQQSVESARYLLQLELERLDELHAAIWDSAAGGNLGAIDRLLKISDRRCRLLGLDAATKVEAPGPEGGPLEIEGALSDRSATFVLGLLDRYAAKAETLQRRSLFLVQRR